MGIWWRWGEFLIRIRIEIKKYRSRLGDIVYFSVYLLYYLDSWKDHIKLKLDRDISIKIVDFGNACWTHKHFTDNIQTREYRSPEAILGMSYDTSTDIWSLACVVYELLTNEYLFKPRKGKGYKKSEDHLA